MGWVKETGGISKGTINNVVLDLLIIKKFGVPCRCKKAPIISEVIWYPPLRGWIKCNTNGLSKPSGQAAYGGPFPNCRGFVCGVFVKNLGIHTAFFAEFYAVLYAVEYAFQRG